MRLPLLSFGIALLFGSGCGTDVDLGGTFDAGPPEASFDASMTTGAGACEPCGSPQDCRPNSLCGQFAGDTFCANVCSGDAGCSARETCRDVTTTAGDHGTACVPTNGICTAALPSGTSDASVDHCGALVAPQVISTCRACGKFSDDCQPNGCYGGYWCNAPVHDCQPPPRDCP